MLQEFVMSYFSYKLNNKWKETIFNNRETIKQVLFEISYTKLDKYEKDFIKTLENELNEKKFLEQYNSFYKEKTKTWILPNFKLVKELVGKYESLRASRNYMSHASFNENNFTYCKLETKLNKAYNEIKRIINTLESIETKVHPILRIPTINY